MVENFQVHWTTGIIERSKTTGIAFLSCVTQTYMCLNISQKCTFLYVNIYIVHINTWRYKNCVYWVYRQIYIPKQSFTLLALPYIKPSGAQTKWSILESFMSSPFIMINAEKKLCYCEWQMQYAADNIATVNDPSHTYTYRHACSKLLGC